MVRLTFWKRLCVFCASQYDGIRDFTSRSRGVKNKTDRDNCEGLVIGDLLGALIATPSRRKTRTQSARSWLRSAQSEVLR
jgi:hypothetical protein